MHSFRLLDGFARSKDGNFAMITAILMIPIAIVVGLAVDYSRATNERATMQNALDAALLGIANLPKDTSSAQRDALFTTTYAANHGPGTARLDSFVINPDGKVVASGSARLDNPNTFMRLARVGTTQISVASAVEKPASLVSAKFEVKLASGWWNKTMTLHGRKRGEKKYSKLLVIDYVYNGAGDPKGYGRTTVSTVGANGSLQRVQEQVCVSATSCTTRNAPGTNGAIVDLGAMDDIYLEMRGGKPNPLKSNDPATSDRLYFDGVEVKKGQKVDIFRAIPCDKRSEQAWEDGGSPVPAPVKNADFFYWVTGKCDYSERPEMTQLTR